MFSDRNLFTDDRAKRSPDKYDDDYSKFLKRNFGQADEKHLDKKEEYKQAQQQKHQEADDDDEDHYEEKSGGAENDEEESEHSKNNDEDSYGVDHDWYYNGKDDYERIKALSEKQVMELHKKPGNCKHYEKDGMVCATCEDPETGDNSESCAYASDPHDKKVAFLSKKSHNYKKPGKAVEVDEPASNDDESEDQEDVAFNSPPKGKPQKSESEDADYGAYKLAGSNDDVEDYDEPKFGQIKAEPKFGQLKAEPKKKIVNDFEILPQEKFESRNLNQALSNFKTKDWSSCNKIMKGDMTCYYCKDHKNAVQEECMFVSASNPKSFKVERSESKSYDNTKPTKKPFYSPPTLEKSQELRLSPIIVPDKKERFARLRVGRPLMPTKASVKSTAEPLVTPKTSLNPNNHDDYLSASNKKAIKRTVSIKKKVFDDDFYQPYDDYEPAESRAIRFESFVRHFD